MSPPGRPPRVFNIPASAPFLPTLVRALVDGRLVPGFAPRHDPLSLASATLYLPTRRACRLVRDVFLQVLSTEAVVLPRIVALGDIDEDEIVFADTASGAGAADALELPPTIGGLERRTLLARLVLQWTERMRPEPGTPPLLVHSPTAALGLADDLARLIDDMTTREVPWEKLDGLVPDEVDRYWQLTLRFLKIAREAWPGILAERQAIEPAARRDLLIAAESTRLAAAGNGPVIAAGSTGSMPATAKLLATIASLPHGAVVLPGLDQDLDEESWKLIAGARDAAGEEVSAPASGHPQFAMQALLDRMGLARAAVVALADPEPHGREILTSEALRPAAATHLWGGRLKDPDLTARLARTAQGLAVVEAATADEEALAIAVALRETLEQPGRTAALVTPDRALARRVTAALGRWNVTVEDSGGDKLPDTAAGVFAALAAETALGGVAPVPLLALLKHPLFRLGQPAGSHARAIAALERAVLRGTRPRGGADGLARTLAHVRDAVARARSGDASDLHPSDPRARIPRAHLDAALALVRRLGGALAPLEKLRGAQPFEVIAGRHRDVLTQLGDDGSGAVSVFTGADGQALALAFDDIDEQGRCGLRLAPADYGEFFRAVIEERVVRRTGTPGASVSIYGPLEARLTQIDRVVIGGLVEGIWPPETRNDAWLSRPMRRALGLDLPERRISLSAHDFAQLLGAPEVILTRATKLAGAPTVASRFLQRLAAVLGDERWAEAKTRGRRYLELATRLDSSERTPPIRRPEPKPPRVARPTSLSVTEIEHWLRDPYTIFAKHILRLDRLELVDTPPGAADRGSAIHAAIGEFATRFADRLPADPAAELLAIGRRHFAALDDHPEARALWWPRFERICRWFASWERSRRSGESTIYAEIRGTISIPLDDRTFGLRGRADRIERAADGRYAILDFKTGAVPSSKQVAAGIAPQLTLEAAILRAGGFAEVPAGSSVSELVYVRLTGGDEAGKVCPVEFKGTTPDAAADDALARLADLARTFEDEATPYRSLVLPMWKNRYGTYDDLARVKEWSLTGGVSEGGEE
ncbi:MAG TPA: double-strand break repair protein AddB [Xanthobacteraceae bacterium]|nr:double-strand break repair protein AddB [Xanthobacteraceae bacterium]